jgi:16S rRNA (uracil1498-N3)-methyltransferase
MTRRRWMADEVQGNRAFLKDSHADHLIRVLRVRLGQQFDISTGTQVFRGMVTGIQENSVEFELGEELLSQKSELELTLALAIFKFDRMEWAIEKSTELGVSRIVPVIARRTEPHLAAASTKRSGRWQRIAVQASEQCRRSAVPVIDPPMKVEAVANLPGSARILLAESEKELTLRSALDLFPRGSDLILAVGPEGGWSESETTLFRERGWTAVRLGHTILRSETAAIAALAVASTFLS